MNDLPKFNTVDEEITNFLHALTKQNEEQKLFQFLNGLDELYATQRSQILLMNPLPSVESVCSMLQQEELQKQVLEDAHPLLESLALLSKNIEIRSGEMKCGVCGNKGHTNDKYWQVIGYEVGIQGPETIHRGKLAYKDRDNSFMDNRVKS